MDGDLLFADAALFGQKAHQMGIGLPINRRGGDRHFQLVAMQADNLVSAGLGLDQQIQPQLLTLPTHGSHLQPRPEDADDTIGRQKDVECLQDQEQYQHREVETAKGWQDPTDRGE